MGVRIVAAAASFGRWSARHVGVLRELNVDLL